MSIIKEYLTGLYSLIDELPFTLLTNIHPENRGEVALYIKGEIIFVDRSEFHVKEYFIAIPELNKLAYSYHYQKHDKELIFRYDNADHYSEIETYPYRKHVYNAVLNSANMEIKAVIDEIIRILQQGL
jgi:hypothetical protein